MDIFSIAKIITAVTTITVGVWKVLKISHKIMDKLEDIESRFKKIEQDVYMLGLMEDKLPVDDRLEFGEEFIKSGGKGYPKIVYDKLVKEASKDE